jgi:hypothetical protein
LQIPSRLAAKERLLGKQDSVALPGAYVISVLFPTVGTVDYYLPPFRGWFQGSFPNSY